MSNKHTLIHTTKTQPSIVYPSMAMAMTVMDTMSVNYLPLYDILPEDGFKYYPLLLFIESLICQSEERIEDLGRAGEEDVFAPFRQAKADILALLAEEKIAHPHISLYLEDVGKFMGYIHQLLFVKEGLSPENLRQALLYAPSDFRLLHTILCCTLDQPINKRLFAMMKSLEVLRDVYWYLENCVHDLERGYFNLYIMYARLYGMDAVQHIVAEKKELENTLAAFYADSPDNEKTYGHKIRLDFSLIHAASLSIMSWIFFGNAFIFITFLNPGSIRSRPGFDFSSL
jgi:hypothetical protein